MQRPYDPLRLRPARLTVEVLGDLLGLGLGLGLGFGVGVGVKVLGDLLRVLLLVRRTEYSDDQVDQKPRALVRVRVGLRVRVGVRVRVRVR